MFPLFAHPYVEHQSRLIVCHAKASNADFVQTESISATPAPPGVIQSRPRFAALHVGTEADVCSAIPDCVVITSLLFSPPPIFNGDAPNNVPSILTSPVNEELPGEPLMLTKPWTDKV